MSQGMEKQIEDLTRKFSENAGGNPAHVVFGAALNMVMTAIHHVPSNAVQDDMLKFFAKAATDAPELVRQQRQRAKHN